MTPEQRAARGDNARRLLDDPLLGEAFASIERQIKDGWAVCDDAAGRERLWYEMRAVVLLKAQLRATLDDGKIAADRLAKDRQKDARPS